MGDHSQTTDMGSGIVRAGLATGDHGKIRETAGDRAVCDPALYALAQPEETKETAEKLHVWICDPKLHALD